MWAIIKKAKNNNYRYNGFDDKDSETLSLEISFQMIVLFWKCITNTYIQFVDL